MLWRIPATLPQEQLFLAEVIREVQSVVWTSVSTQVTTDSQLHYIPESVQFGEELVWGPPQEPRAKVVQNM